MKILVLVFCALTLSAQSIVTNWNNLTIPAAPTRPGTGNTWTDPTFGTTVMQVTDGTTDSNNSCYHGYSYWQVISKESKRLLLQCSGRQIKIFDLDATNFTLSGPCTVAQYLATNRGDDNMQFSMANERVFYTLGLGEKTLLKFTFSGDTGCAGSWSVVKDFTGIIDYNYFIQFSMAEDDSVFAGSDRDGGGVNHSCIVYYASGTYAGTTAKITPGWDIDECQIDKTGRWLTIKPDLDANGVILWDTTTQSTVTNLSRSMPVASPAHSDSGRGFIVGNNGNDSTGTGLVRAFTSPTIYKTTVPASAAYITTDISVRANNEQWYLGTGENTAVGAQTAPLKGELAFIRTDGSQLVRRVGFHYASSVEPKGLVSYDGQFVLWRSDWMAGGRVDVFMSKVTAPPIQRTSGKHTGKYK